MCGSNFTSWNFCRVSRSRPQQQIGCSRLHGKWSSESPPNSLLQSRQCCAESRWSLKQKKSSLDQPLLCCSKSRCSKFVACHTARARKLLRNNDKTAKRSRRDHSRTGDLAVLPAKFYWERLDPLRGGLVPSCISHTGGPAELKSRRRFG